MDTPTPEEQTAAQRFAEKAREASPGAAREFFDFLRQNKKWWLLPIVAILLLVGALIVLTGTVPVLLYPW
jgi:hypothetical protein